MSWSGYGCISTDSAISVDMQLHVIVEDLPKETSRSTEWRLKDNQYERGITNWFFFRITHCVVESFASYLFVCSISKVKDTCYRKSYLPNNSHKFW
jgi:hypothetical protein